MSEHTEVILGDFWKRLYPINSPRVLGLSSFPLAGEGLGWGEVCRMGHANRSTTPILALPHQGGGDNLSWKLP